MSVQLFGGLRVLVDGAAVDVPSGAPARLLRLVAAHGTLPVERVLELMWPGVEPTTGRTRLRNVLSRLRTVCGDVLVRSGHAVAVGPDVQVDLVVFEAAARRALSLPPGPPAEEAAKAALAGCAAGELLPEDVYADWAAAPRERARRYRLALLDAVAAGAAAQGDVSRAMRSWQEAIELEPYDESRYVTAAEALVACGRWGAAHALLGRADRALSALGLPASPELARLRRSMTGGEQAG